MDILDWYIPTYLVEFVIVIFLQAKYSRIEKITVFDLLSVLIIPALIVVVPVALMCLYPYDIFEIVLWRKKE